MAFGGPSKVEQLLEKQLEEERTARKQDLANLRADHAAAIATLIENHRAETSTLQTLITQLREDLDRTRLLLHPGLATARETDSGPTPAIPEEQTGSRWERIVRNALKQQDELAELEKKTQKKSAVLAEI